MFLEIKPSLQLVREREIKAEKQLGFSTLDSRAWSMFEGYHSCRKMKRASKSRAADWYIQGFLCWCLMFWRKKAPSCCHQIANAFWTCLSLPLTASTFFCVFHVPQSRTIEHLLFSHVCLYSMSLPRKVRTVQYSGGYTEGRRRKTREKKSPFSFLARGDYRGKRRLWYDIHWHTRRTYFYLVT